MTYLFIYSIEIYKTDAYNFIKMTLNGKLTIGILPQSQYTKLIHHRFVLEIYQYRYFFDIFFF